MLPINVVHRNLARTKPYVQGFDKLASRISDKQNRLIKNGIFDESKLKTQTIIDIFENPKNEDLLEEVLLLDFPNFDFKDLGATPFSLPSTKFRPRPKVLEPLFGDEIIQRIADARDQTFDTKSLKELKTALSNELEDLLTIKDAGALYSNSELTTKFLNTLLNSIKKLDISELNQILDTIIQNNLSVQKAFQLLTKAKAIKEYHKVETVDVGIINKLTTSYFIPTDRLVETYPDIRKLENDKTISDIQKSTIYHILFGDKRQYLGKWMKCKYDLYNPLYSIFDRFGYNSSSIDLQGVPIVNSNRSKLLKTLDAQRISEKSFLGKLQEFFQAKTIGSLITRLKSSLNDITLTKKFDEMLEVPSTIDKSGSADIKIKKAILYRLPKKYIDSIQSDSYDIKFLTKSETTSSIKEKYCRKNSSNIIEMPNRTFTVELRLKDKTDKKVIADRLLGEYDPDTKSIVFDTFCKGGLHKPTATSPGSLVIGPKSQNIDLDIYKEEFGMPYWIWN